MKLFEVPSRVSKDSEGIAKTRSGKVMRRILRKVAEGDFRNLGDISTLADPDVVNAIINAEIHK